MRWFHSEPTIAEMLSDPIVRALMAADRVAPEELQANLTKIAATLRPQHREMRHGRQVGNTHKFGLGGIRLSARPSETFPTCGACAERLYRCIGAIDVPNP